MRTALAPADPEAQPGEVMWRVLAEGFEVSDLPVLSDGREVDRVLLTRFDPARFRLEARNLPSGSRRLQEWMAEPGVLAAVNGSYYGSDGTPDTPLVSNGRLLGPPTYAARHGAFMGTGGKAEVRDLAALDWQSELSGAENAMVSYPLLLAADGSHRVRADRRWLANRTFVAQDGAGRIVLGTTTDAFFSLERLAVFLKTAPLDLKVALNLDGGPVACQGVRLGDYSRDFCGRWETSVRDGQLSLLTWPWGERWGLPIALVVRRR